MSGTGIAYIVDIRVAIVVAGPLIGFALVAAGTVLMARRSRRR